MKKSNHYWFLFLFLLILLLIPNACETSDPAALPRYPISNLPSANISLQVVAPSSVSANVHPLQIDAMRARDYPGSDIVIEQVLDPGVNYSRYYVSYLSDGLKIYAL